MPIVGDFTIIVGDEDKRVGDPHQSRTFEFLTGEPRQDDTGFISLMVKGMTVTKNNAQVKLNGKVVGKIFNNNGGKKDAWQTQTVSFAGRDLKHGRNLLELTSVSYPGGGDDHYDDYFVRNLICHFHQHA